MSKILSVDDLLEIAEKLKLPNFNELKERLELVTHELAINVATTLGVKADKTSWEGKEFAGLATTIRPAIQGQACPDLIHQADITGDWE